MRKQLFEVHNHVHKHVIRCMKKHVPRFLIIEALHFHIYFKYTVVDTGFFRHWYTDFGHTNLGMPKFNLK